MAVFAYRALDVAQQPVAGTISADTPALARHSLRAQGLAIAELDLVTPSRAGRPAGASRLFRRERLDGDRVAELWRNLAMLLNAGVPLVEALETCRRQAHRSIEPVLRQIHDAVRGGTALPDALKLHPALCDDLTAAIVSVGNQSGALPTALVELAEHLTRRRATANRLATALIYPAILCAVGFAVVIFLMTYVVPQLVDVLSSAGRTLPWPTRLLKGISDALVANFVILAVAAAAIVTGLLAFVRTTSGRRMRERVELLIPVWGDLVRKSWVSRIATMLATMLRVEVRFTEALRVVRASLPHRLYASELERLEKQLEAGAEIAAPLQGSRLIPPLVVHLLAVGQESGELPQMLSQIRDHYEREVQQAVTRFLAVLEPALILLLAAVIGFVVFATLLPILETTKVVQ